MRVAALFSGGKDSACAAHRAAGRGGHEVACLVTVAPRSEESWLFHHPCIRLTALQAESMGLPHVYAEQGRGESDASALASALGEAAREHGARGVVHGGIRSRFQRSRFEAACGALGLAALSPVWGEEARAYMRGLLAGGFRFAVTGVAAGGLGREWLGREVDGAALGELERLSVRHGFGLDFEGGEAETLVLDCPMFSRPLRILRSAAAWDGCRGRLEIKEAELGPRRA